MVRYLSAIWLTLASLGLGASCHLVGGTDGLFIEELGGSSTGTGGGGTGGSSTSSSSSSSTTGTGGGGGSGDCSSIDPPPPNTDCAYYACIQDSWQLLTQPTTTVCDENGGAYCDGAGNCVQCTMDEHCLGDSPCQDFQCVAASCEDGLPNGGETGTDCGGPCGGCPNGEGCNSDSDCLSWFCDGESCAGCASHSDCPNSDDWYCALNGDNACHLKKGLFAGCNNDYECQSGNCGWLSHLCY
ncbi:MAG: hypothetical protein DRI90_10990 [Deltaproteobacteria bacterium]|nr:MAG: hypothetical protein DRI90_10990 [Deltaproteobacteria bacterium]